VGLAGTSSSSSNSLDEVDGIGKNADEARLTFNYFNSQLAALFFDRGRLRSYHPQADQKAETTIVRTTQRVRLLQHAHVDINESVFLLMPVPVAFQHHAQLPFFRL
jgi:hypothetical protein